MAEKNKHKRYFYNFDNKDDNFNFMGALPTTTACLKCHEHQGYKVGDIRGGIRVSIPIELHQEHISLLEEKTKSSLMIIIFSPSPKFSIAPSWKNIIFP